VELQMNPPTTPDRPAQLPPADRSVWLAGLALVLAALAAYHNSFSVPFLFDDAASITNNPTIRHLSHLGEVLKGPPWGALTVNGRPLLNLTLAINYALGGLEVGGYHWVNLAIHCLAGLVLFGVVRRSLLQPVLAESLGQAAVPIAFTTALLWLLHPMQTEAVTYLIQRAESQVGLCYLLTLYAFIRATTAAEGTLWYVLTVVFCLLGMAAKEVMATAPVMVFFYDRTFVAGTFAGAWRRRWWLYVALAATWLLLAWLMLGSGSRGEAGAFDSGTRWYQYAATEFGVVLHYLRMIFWPVPLILDYGGAVLEKSALRIALSALAVMLLLAGTVVGLRRRPVLGFLGCWFFGILAPTSSVVPLVDTIFEHRIYLSLAAVLVLLVAGIYRWLGRGGFWMLAALAVAFGFLATIRNRDYRSEFAIWTDTVAKRPDNARAYNNLGSLWLGQDKFPEAERCFRTAVKLQPGYPSANYNLGIVLTRTHRPAEAVPFFLTAINVEETFVDARVNAGIALTRIGRPADAVTQYEAALRLQPDSPDIHYNLGLALGQLGRSNDAIREYEAALRLDPKLAQAQADLAALRAGQGDLQAAARGYLEAIRLQPGLAAAHLGLGDLLVQANRFPEAIEEYRKVLQADAGDVHARFNLANALLVTGHLDEAIAEYERILQTNPNEPGVRENLQQARAMKSQPRSP
jgi:tetratricopeptide (TPR) repeat protein